MKRILWLVVISLCLFSLSSFAKPLPIEAFASIPDVRFVSLSPDGKKIASLVRVSTNELEGQVLTIRDIQTNKDIYPLQTDNQKFVILSLTWANNDVILIESKYPAIRRGVPTTETRLIKYSLSDNKTSSVFSNRSLSRFVDLPQLQASVIDYLDTDPNHILMQIQGLGSKPQYESVVKVSLKTGGIKTLQPARMHIGNWLTDRQHNVRIGIYRDDTTYRIYEQKGAGEDLRKLWEFEALAEDVIWPIGFDHDPNILYISAYHQGFKAIFKVNLTDPTLTKELVSHNENYDIEGWLVYSALKQKVIGLSTDIEGEYLFWDQDYIKLNNGLTTALPESHNVITQFSDDERRYIVYATGPIESGAYYFGNRDQKALYPIAYRYSQLPPEVLSQPQTVHYNARDGLAIEAFLTTPKDIVAKNLPTIIFPHGGPISYDSTTFDYWAQFLANRGYAVLQMNFRGSSGYGFNFMNSGLKNWGLEMQTDIEDGTHWLIEQGISDPKRVCIVGASYGGYAALMGVAITPDLYQCAISVAGVTDLEYLVKSSRRYDNSKIVKKQIGDDYDDLYQRSPISKVANINVPVLLIHGTKDRVVRVQHSEEMYDALKDLHKPVKYIELENGDHYLSSNEHRLTTFIAIEHFLATNLGVK
ncbi:S9 family peptidase [Shewanella sp. Arc9-LZ]|uniref:alpha/beta hydrolase family protein n=1 Tax=Shewanella sp. Arc9-LZ TaxID=2698686 RepID=UPI00137C2829|nr:S9 family peptidase [Shewanella sp. Arc9-LZ]QHS11848.1 S9 family peptidase [Shewanella sp. Arc9-LZ]|tara:strand:+ start:5705 stop:7639 length:1935 start_codon:yes stop_codon:yes gene_type:complete